MNNICIKSKTANIWQADVCVGSHIEAACTEAIEVATKESVSVAFDFNCPS